jgi:hypothetical protein
MKWKVKEAKPERNETKWYPHFPLFLPVQINDQWYWLTWVEERYTGYLTGQDGNKIYEWRERQVDTPPNGPVRMFSAGNWIAFAIIALYLFTFAWNHFQIYKHFQ